jgi:phage-related minor tail protein
MLTQLSETLELINHFNKSDFVKKKIDQEALKEQQHNLSDLKKLLENYSKNIKMLGDKEKIERSDLTVFIVEVHASLMNLIWHIDEIDDLLRTFSKSLSEKES